MSEARLEKIDFDRWLSLSEKAAHDAVVASNNAFTAALMKAAARGRETIHPGTFVDSSAAICARRLAIPVPMSPCGSPAALCVELGNPHGGTITLK